MDEIKVSIIIPIFNSGGLLINCLNSVKNQTLKNIEILCFVDEYDEDSLEILNSFFDKDSRFKIFSLKNSGLLFAKNFGIDYAKGKYIVFLDSQDWIEKDMFERLYNQALNLNNDLLLFNVINHNIDETTSELTYFNDFDNDYSSFTFDYHFIKDKIMDDYYMEFWNKFYKSSFIKENMIYFTNYYNFNEIGFHMKNLILAKSISYYPNIFYHHSIQPNLNDFKVSVNCFIDFYDEINDVKDFLINNNLMSEFRIEFLNFVFSKFKEILNRMDLKYKSQFFLKSQEFFESLNILPSELVKIEKINIPYFIHILNSANFEEFEFIQNNFDYELIDFELLNSFKFYDVVQNEDILSTNDRIDELLFNQIYVDILENEIFNIHDELNYNRRMMSTLTDELIEKESQINKLEDKCSNLDYSIEKLDNINKNLYDENYQLKKYIKNFNKDFEKLKRDLSSLEMLKVSIKEENDYLKNSINNLINECTDLRKKLK